MGEKLNKNTTICMWVCMNFDEQNYTTGCDDVWTLLEGTPEENNMKFCPMCGRRIISLKITK